MSASTAITEGQWGQVARLRRWTCGTHIDDDDDECDVCHLEVDCRHGADEIEELRRWKAEAIEVIGAWEDVWHALGQPGELGESKAIAALRTVLANGSDHA